MNNVNNNEANPNLDSLQQRPVINLVRETGLPTRQVVTPLQTETRVNQSPRPNPNRRPIRNPRTTPREVNFLPNSKLRIIPLGGVEEIGINSTVYEYKNDIVVVDLGLGFSEYDYYGIDAVVPDIKYLQQRKNNIKGIVITHGHLDHIGALSYHLPTLGFPHLYGSKFTIELIKAKLEDNKILEAMKNKMHVIDRDSKLKLGNFNLGFFHVNHSIPQCLGVVIQTPDARVVQTGDFKFDNTPVNEPVADYAKIAELGELGVDLLLSDSTNSLRKGHPISESEVAKNLEDVIERAEGRVIIGTFSGLVGRLYQLLDIAKRQNRRVAIAGYSMNQTLRIAEEIKYIKIPKGLVIPIQEVEKHPKHKVLILTTGAQGETNAGLSKMAVEDYKGFQLGKGDMVILSAKTIPGNDKAVQNLVDSITRRGAIVTQMDDLDLFTSGHGYQEDQKIMLNLVKPRFFMPVHGYQYFLRAHAETAKSVGMKESNIIIAERGSIIEGNNRSSFKIVSKINCEPMLVSGSGVGDVGTAVLKEREQLASYGVLIISLNINSASKDLINSFITSRGFVYVKSSQELLQDINKKTAELYLKVKSENKDIPEIKESISKEIGKLVFKETEREPIIVTMINFV